MHRPENGRILLILTYAIVMSSCFTKILLSVLLISGINARAQTTVAELKDELARASTVKAKADACFKISEWLRNAKKIDSAIYYANETKRYSGEVHYETGIGKYYLALAEGLFFRGKNDEVEANASKAAEIFARQKETQLLGKAYQSMGTSRYAAGQLELSRKYLWTAAAIYGSINDSKGLYFAYFWLARGYFKKVEIDSGSYYAIKALSMAEQSGDQEKIYQAGCWAGDAFWSIGEYDKAVGYFDLGLRNRLQSSDKVGVRSYMCDYAVCLAFAHEFSKGDSILKHIEAINSQLKDSYGDAMLNWARGAMAYEKTNYDQAVIFLRHSTDIMHASKITNTDAKDMYLQLAKAEYATGSYDSAIVHLRMALQIAQRFRTLIDERDADLLISNSFQQKENADSALYYFKNYSVLKDSISSQQKQKNIIEVATRYETEKKEQEIKILEKEKEAGAYALALKNQQIEKQKLQDEKKSQQLLLLSQQSEISRLEASEKTLALQNQQKEILKKQKELEMVSRQSLLEAAVATKQSQQKKIAYAAVLAVLLFAGIAFYRSRQSRKLSKQLAVSLASLKEAQDQLIKTEIEKEAENVRVRISRDIHDEVGATLSGVALFSEIARQKMEQKQEQDAQLYLDHISVNSKEMVEKMSDIVWAINPENDSFERIVTKLRSYAFNLCAGKGIALHVDIDEAIRNHYPSMQVKRNLYLLMKEAVNNAVKYSGAANIFLSLQTKAHAVVVEIKDDGKGFDATKNHGGNGLPNMRARAESLAGNLSVESQQEKGTCIRLEFEFHPAGGQQQKV